MPSNAFKNLQKLLVENEDVAVRVKTEQTKLILQSTPLLMSIHAMVGGILMWIFHMPTNAMLVYAWGVALFAAIAFNLDCWRRYKKGAKHTDVNQVLHTIVTNATALSIVWGVAMVALFPISDGKHQLALVCIVISMMSLGAFAYANVRQAAVSYVTVFTVCTICALLMTKESIFVLLSGVQGIWGLAVIVAVLHYSLIFAERLATRSMFNQQDKQISSLETDLFDQIGAACFETNGDGLLVKLDRRFVGFFNRSLAELKGTPFADLIIDDDRLATHPDYLTRDKLDYLLSADEVFKNSIIASMGDEGKEYWRLSIRCSGRNREAGFGKLGVITNATDEIRNMIKLSTVTSTDLRTGMPNREAFQKQVRRALVRNLEQQKPFACLHVSISNIDDLCEYAGAHMRAIAIKTVARRLKTALQGHGYLATLGDAEFGVLCPHRENTAQNLTVLKGLSHYVGRPISHNRATLRPKVSIGYAVAPVHANTVSGLMEAARRAEQLAKSDMSRPWYMLEDETQTNAISKSA